MKIRQGRDIVLVWNLYKLVKSTSIIEGEITERTPVDLDTALDIVVTLKHRVYGSFSKVLTVTAVGNQITAEIGPTEQTYLGDYYLIITLNHVDETLADGKRKFTADAPAYTVVGATEEEDTEDETTVTSTSVFGFEGLSAYELSVRYGTFTGTEAEYAALIPDLVEASDIATSSANTAATAANEAASDALDATTIANFATENANAATLEANSAADLANTKAGLADEKATLANNAATNATTVAGNVATAEGLRVAAEGGRVTAESAREQYIEEVKADFNIYKNASVHFEIDSTMSLLVTVPTASSNFSLNANGELILTY